MLNMVKSSQNTIFARFHWKKNKVKHKVQDLLIQIDFNEFYLEKIVLIINLLIICYCFIINYFRS